MDHFLVYTVVLLGLTVLIGFFNEKKTRLTYEISLMLFSVVLGLLLVFAVWLIPGQSLKELFAMPQIFDLEGFLMKGVLCFMLFAGSFKMHLIDFKTLARPIGVLAVLCTFLGAFFYGLLFFLAARLLSLPLSLPVCLMFGSIVAPTDPIAATSILNKFGLPKNISFVIEGESLLNDGVGVALFVCFSGIAGAGAGEGGGFLRMLLWEILGAVLTGGVITAVCWPVFTGTKDPKRRIYVSLFMVALAYFLCERLGCSGAIASVACGTLFATLRRRWEEAGRLSGEKEDSLAEFDTFWEIIDNLLNSVLYIMLGLSFVRILQMPYVVLLSLAAVLCNLIARSGSLYISTFFMGELPDGYKKGQFVKLFTWGGLRGALSIALAMSTGDKLDHEVYYIILGCTYAIVFFTTIVQGLTMKKAYERISRG